MGRKINKLLVIYGPTAVGKTELGIELARQFKGEIVSADSRQIYQGMDIGTGKDIGQAKFVSQADKYPLGKLRAGYYRVDGVKIWLLDLILPSQKFSSFAWAKLAGLIIKDIWFRGGLPIVLGGSAFYIKTLIDGLDATTKADWRLRKKLEKLSLNKLQARLKSISHKKWSAMTKSDQKNPRRLIRAIEKEAAPSRSWRALPDVNLLAIGLRAERGIIRSRIEARAKKRLDQGLLKEIESLTEKYNWSSPGLNALGYRGFKDYLSGKKGLKETVDSWVSGEYQYAKRQLLWFRQDSRFVWFDTKKKDFTGKINKLVKSWYS